MNIDRTQNSMTRRHALKIVAGSIATPMILSRTAYSRTVPGGLLRIGCIGTGRMGHGDMQNAIYRGLSEATPARVVAVCDLDADRARLAAERVESIYRDELAGSGVERVGVHGDYRELLARDDIDAVTISTPDHWHALTAIAAAEAGKSIYLQKPLTYSIAEGTKLVRAVRKNRVVLQTGSQQRSSHYFRRTCELVRNGRIGKLRSIEVRLPVDTGVGTATPMKVPANLDYDMWLGPAPETFYTEDRVHPREGFGRPGWLQIETFCRGMITGWGAHMYDIAQWGLGTDVDSGPIEVEATAEFPRRGLFDVHTRFRGKALYANGVKLISSSGDAGVKFIGDEGWIWVERGSMKPHDPKLLRERIRDDEVRLYESRDHMSNFLECARNGTEPICPVEVGHRSNTVCVLHHIAMKLGRKLAWNPETEAFTNNSDANALLDYPHRKPWLL